MSYKHIKQFIPAPPGYRFVFVSWHRRENGEIYYDPYSLPIVAFGIDEEDGERYGNSLVPMVLEKDGMIDTPESVERSTNVCTYGILEPGEEFSEGDKADAIEQAQKVRGWREEAKAQKKNDRSGTPKP